MSVRLNENYHYLLVLTSRGSDNILKDRKPWRSCK